MINERASSSVIAISRGTINPPPRHLFPVFPDQILGMQADFLLFDNVQRNMVKHRIIESRPSFILMMDWKVVG